MTTKNDPPNRGIEGRFRDLSADVREERLVRYIVHQVETGRHLNEIVKDSYIVDHFDEVARNRILEHPAVIKSIEQSVRRQFAGCGDSVAGSTVCGGDQDSAGRGDNGDVSDL
jgi:hypothetical protein